MNYYNTFTTATIDALLQNTMKDGYCLETTSTSEKTYYSTIYKKKVKRNNHDTAAGSGRSIPVDTYLRSFLHKEAMEAVMGDFNWEHEYVSPFDNGINQMLLIHKWITGLQSLTKDIVSIKKTDLAKLDMDHKSVMDIKIAFDRLFPTEIVKSTYDSGTWFIKLGGRSLRIGEGPGYIKIKMQIPYLIEKIKADHDTLKTELSAEIDT